MKNLLKNSRGVALVMVIFVMSILLTVIGASLLFSQLELKKTSQYKTGTMAFFAAEAGLAHSWRELDNGDGVNDFNTIHSSPVGTLIVSNPVFSGASYTVTLLDSLNNPRRVRVASVGTAPNNSQARLEAWLRGDVGTAPKAFITNGDLKLNGNPSFLGLLGGGHSNDDMQLSGNPAVQMPDGLTVSNSSSGGGELSDGMDISGNPCIGSSACASDPQPDEYVLDTDEEKDAYESSHNSDPVYPIPEINPAHYASAVAGNSAGYVLKADCTVVTGADATFSNGLHTSGGTVVSAPSGWSCSDGTWKVPGDSVVNGVFYAEGRVEVSGKPGSVSNPWQVTIVARDSINVSGNPSMEHYPTASEKLKNIQFVTGNDLELSGNPDATGYQGAIRAHQQVKINGNPNIYGFIMAGDGLPTWLGDPFPDGSLGVEINEVSGDPNITYNGDLEIDLLSPKVVMIGWHQTF